MAEAVAALGVGASVLQFVTVTGRLVQRINEFSHTAEELPAALRSIHLQLPFLVETCENLDTGDKTEKISAIIDGCQKEIEELHKMLNKTLPNPGDPKLNRAFKALRSIHYQDKFEIALRKIEQFKTDLILHCQTTKSNPVHFLTTERVTHILPTKPMTPSISRRKLLREIDKKFNEDDCDENGHKIVILLGMGGQGKSRLALDYGQQIVNEGSPKLVIWVDATSAKTVTRSFEDVADRWNDRKRRFTDTELRIDFVKNTLASREWLLIFDNYDHPDLFANVCDFIPPGNGAILMTSRHADAGQLGKVVHLSGLDNREGLELLRRRTAQNLDDPMIQGEAMQILQALGHLPLAVDQAGAYIRQQMLPLHQFSQLYESQREAVLNQKHVYWDYKKRLDSDDKEETPLGVLTTWELSMQQVGNARIPRATTEHLLTIAAFLGQVEISENLFREYAERVRPIPKWLQCFTMNDEWDSHAYRSIVSELLRLSLAQGRSSSADEFCLSLHPMIKDWLQLRIVEADRCKYILETMSVLANYIDANVQERSLQEARGLLGHLDACIHSHRKFRSPTSRLGFGHLRSHAVLFSKFYMSHGRYREAEEGFHAVLQNDTQNYGDNHGNTLQTTRHLADALVHGGNYHKAHDLLSRALQESKKRVNVETIHILSGLATVFAKLDRLADAEKYYEAALQGYAAHKTLSQSRKMFLLYERLAEVKRYLGKNKEAESLYKTAHQGYEQECAYDEEATLDMLRTAGGLADLLRMGSRYAEAELSYREAWQGYKRQFGPDHPKTMVMLTNLAISCRNQEKFKEAESYLAESVKICEKNLGAEHPDTLRALMNLSICIDKQGHYKEAEVNYRRVLQGREKKLGLNHPYTLRTIERLAHMLWMQGQRDKAETLVRRILAKKARLFSETTPEPGDDRKFPALEILYSEAWNRCVTKMSADHVDALETYECLRLVYIEQGQEHKIQGLAHQIDSAKAKREKENELENKKHKPEEAADEKGHRDFLAEVVGSRAQPRGRILAEGVRWLLDHHKQIGLHAITFLLGLFLLSVWSSWFGK